MPSAHNLRLVHPSVHSISLCCIPPQRGLLAGCLEHGGPSEARVALASEFICAWRLGPLEESNRFEAGLEELRVSGANTFLRDREYL